MLSPVLPVFKTGPLPLGLFFHEIFAHLDSYDDVRESTRSVAAEQRLLSMMSCFLQLAALHKSKLHKIFCCIQVLPCVNTNQMCRTFILPKIQPLDV